MASLLKKTATTIEDYQVHNLLGKGGFASVYRARCLKQGTVVAIKMIEKQVIQANNLKSRVNQEIKIHRTLKHPSILELYKYFEDNNYVYLVLELCHNGDLQNYVKEKRLPENEVSNIMGQVVEGITYLHSRNVLHRDLSLSNLLLTKGMQVKIADFGLATELTKPDEKHMTMCGTPNFISPEVASRGSHGLETDIWGLGCLLYTLLVGSPPFETPALKSTLTKVVMSSYSLPDHLSPEARDLINALLHKNPKDRMKLNQILDHAFMKRGRIIYSHPKYDSGMYTMSSKRDSMFRDTTSLPPSHIYTSNDQIRKTNSDCLPLRNTNSQFCTDMDRLRIHNYEGIPTYRDLSEQNSKCLRQSEQTSKCCSGFSNCCNQQEVKRPCSGMTSCLRSCCQERHLPADPGGCNSNHLKCSTALHSHHSDPPYNNNTNNHLYKHCSAGYTHTSHDRTEKYVKQREPSPRRCETVKTSLTPLCSERLLPIRNKGKPAVMSILEDGEVCIEFTKKLGSKKDYVHEVMRISTDGMRIVLYKLGGKGVPLDEKPVPIPVQGADKIYGLENLPKTYWKKYRYATTFVDMVRAKTPKVTYYSDKATFSLMENLTDFDANFYDGGKVTKWSDEGITIIDASGQKFNFVSQTECDALSGTLDLMWTHSQDCFKRCTLYEKMLSTVPDSFPIRVGRKPSSASSLGKENRPQTMPSFAVSSTGTNSGSTSRNKANMREQKVVIPGIGTAVALANRVIEVRFLDGSQLLVNGKSDVHYQYIDGRRSSYKYNEKMPMVIQEKLNLMPKVLEYFSPSSVTQKIVNLR